MQNQNAALCQGTPTTTPLRARQTSDCQQHGSQLHYRNLGIAAYC
jgi:hypothetical protein